MNVLIGYSCCQLTRKAFADAGHKAFTCDLLPARGGDQTWHLQADVWDVINMRVWDFAIFHPMCTYLTTSAAWAFKDPDYAKWPGVGYHQKVKPGTLVGVARRAQRSVEIDNFRWLLGLPFPAVVENPAVSFVNKAILPPTQVVQPYMFGDDASKATGLWHNDAALHAGLPTLYPSRLVIPRIVDGRPRWANQTDSGQNRVSPSETRWLERSKTYPGIAAALGEQYGRWLHDRA